MKIAIIGAGAAGCFAAANIPRDSGHEVVIFEKTGKSLQKVKVSGGGRCNVTHDCSDIPELVKRYPRGTALLKKALHHFSPKDTVAWFAARGVRIKSESDGRMFPDTDSSQTIIDCLTESVRAEGAVIRYHHTLKSVSRNAATFLLTFDGDSTYEADRLLLASGSILKPDAFQWLSQLGHCILPPAPSLFTFNIPGNPITGLMGLSVEDAAVKIEGTKFVQRGPLLITHWGMSGPAVLKASAWCARILQEKDYHFTTVINWLGDATEIEIRNRFDDARQQTGKQLVLNKNPFGIPKRLWEHFCIRAAVGDTTKWAELTVAAQKILVQSLVADRYEVCGKTTYKEEFVTCGGISIAEINAQTMESRIIPGLFFSGECMDADGITGGYNFQHAWCSGWLAAKAIAAKL